MRLLYICLLRWHPAFFRQRFGDEMLSIFDQTPGVRARTALLADGVTSLMRQRTLRPQFREAPQAAVPSSQFDGVPVFYTCGSSLPRTGPLISGAILSVAVVALVGFGIGRGRIVSYRGTQVSRAATSPSTAVERASNAKDSVGEPDELSALARNYIALFPLLSALDANHDGVISRGEIANAPLALKTVDRNADGKLTAEECGARFAGSPEGGSDSRELTRMLMAFDRNTDGKLEKNEVPESMQGLFQRGDSNGDGVLSADEIRMLVDAGEAHQDPPMSPAILQRAHRAFMRLHPLLAQLDADHDGELSSSEIIAATAALQAADKNRDGRLTEDEYLPDAMSNAVALVMSRADTDWDGTISKQEKHSVLANPYRKLIDDSDRNGDGVVTAQELRNEIRRVADFNRDGIVTHEEVRRAGQSGLFLR